MPSNIFLHLTYLAENQGSRTALYDTDGTKLSYSELLRHVNHTIYSLHDSGITRILVISNNSIDSAILFLASLCSGIEYCPIAYDSTKQEILEAISKIKPNGVFSDLNFRDDLDKDFSPIKTFQISLDISSLVDEIDSKNEIICSGRLIISTSGSEGSPKKLVINGDVLWNSAAAFKTFYGLDKNLNFWNYLPMSYLGGLYNLLLIPLATGGSILIDKGFNGLTLLNFWKTVQNEKITVLWLVPTILRALIRLNKNSESKRKSDLIQWVFIGTAPLSESERNVWEEMFGLPLLENYGLTETTFIFCQPHPDTRTPKELKLNEWVFPGVEIRFSGPSKNQIEVRTPYLFEGYLSDSNGINPISRDDFFKTGDLGRSTDNGFIIEGRLKDVIKKGGLLINLAEMDLRFRQIISNECICSSMEDQFYGENYELLVLEPFEEFELNQLMEFIKVNLRKSIWPKQIRFLPKFVYTGSGKIIRKQGQVQDITLNTVHKIQ